jgi:hypothetical protein
MSFVAICIAIALSLIAWRSQDVSFKILLLVIASLNLMTALHMIFTDFDHAFSLIHHL